MSNNYLMVYEFQDKRSGKDEKKTWGIRFGDDGKFHIDGDLSLREIADNFNCGHTEFAEQIIDLFSAIEAHINSQPKK